MEITRPDTFVIKITNKDGSTYLEDEAINLDLLLSKAQAGINLEDAFATEVWLDRFRDLLVEEYESLQVVTRQDAWLIVRTINTTMASLKKSLPESLTLLSPTE
jgi:hypothetical protein